ncbi:MAG TPA: hypothetical protein VM347_03310 [Nonomuraea sp.]|nr:hypothetical protein [Nonomuraea sp.]
MRFLRVRGAAVLLGAVATLLLGAGPAGAAENPEKIKVTLAQSAIVNTNPNNITMDITIVNPGTKKPPVARYGVFLTAREGAGEPILEQPELCLQVADNDPLVPPGVYRCSIIVNNPGAWTFTAFVNLPTTTGQKQLQVVETTVDITGAVVLEGQYKGLRYAVEGKSFEVFLLQFHVILATLWLLLVGTISFIAVPRLRRMISTLALQTLEVRRSVLTSGMWVTFGGTLITGAWLLTTQTAYDAPFSTSNFSFSDYDNLTRLPYASLYFNALYIKILVFLVMGGASMVLAMEAARQAQAAQDVLGDEDEIDMWATGVHFDEEGHVRRDPPAATEQSGRTAVATHSRAAPVGISQRTLWACVAVMVGGTGVIGLCVTILKYCHELIETANAENILKNILGG